MAGDDIFKNEVEKKLSGIFQFSKVEENRFKYCGCNISKENSDIVVDQHDYVDNLKPMKIPLNEESNRNLKSDELKLLRGKIGEVLWISLITRPDLSFEVNRLAGEVPRATLKTISDMNKLIARAKSRKESSVKFSNLGDISDLNVKVCTDDCYNNQDESILYDTGRRTIARWPHKRT